MNRMIYLRLGALHLPFSLRFLSVQAGLLVAILLTAAIALWQGTQQLAPLALWHWLIGSADADTAALMQLRLPRIVVALLGGAMVAASGYLLQVVSGNDLADPGLIGISQGTSAVILLGTLWFVIPAGWLAAIGLLGGLLTGALVIGLALRVRSANGLILIGLAVSITLGAIIEILMVSGNIAQFARYISWSHGSLAAVSAADMVRLLQWAAALSLALLFASRLMAPLLLGSEQAAALGARPARARLLLTLLATALVAPVVAITGPLSFIGLIAAHAARRLVANHPGELLPTTLLCGALLLLLADLAGRTLFLPLIIPAGLIASLAGVIGFLLIARATRKQR